MPPAAPVPAPVVVAAPGSSGNVAARNNMSVDAGRSAGEPLAVIVDGDDNSAADSPTESSSSLSLEPPIPTLEVPDVPVPTLEVPDVPSVRFNTAGCNAGTGFAPLPTSHCALLNGGDGDLTVASVIARLNYLELSVPPSVDLVAGGDALLFAVLEFVRQAAHAKFDGEGRFVVRSMCSSYAPILPTGFGSSSGPGSGTAGGAVSMARRFHAVLEFVGTASPGQWLTQLVAGATVGHALDAVAQSGVGAKDRADQCEDAGEAPLSSWLHVVSAGDTEANDILLARLRSYAVLAGQPSQLLWGSDGVLNGLEVATGTSGTADSVCGLRGAVRSLCCCAFKEYVFSEGGSLLSVVDTIVQAERRGLRLCGFRTMYVPCEATAIGGERSRRFPCSTVEAVVRGNGGSGCTESMAVVLAFAYVGGRGVGVGVGEATGGTAPLSPPGAEEACVLCGAVLRSVLGPEDPELARRTDPGSVRAVHGDCASQETISPRGAGGYARNVCYSLPHRLEGIVKNTLCLLGGVTAGGAETTELPVEVRTVPETLLGSVISAACWPLAARYSLGVSLSHLPRPGAAAPVHSGDGSDSSWPRMCTFNHNERHRDAHLLQHGVLAALQDCALDFGLVVRAYTACAERNDYEAVMSANPVSSCIYRSGEGGDEVGSGWHLVVEFTAKLHVLGISAVASRMRVAVDHALTAVRNLNSISDGVGGTGFDLWRADLELFRHEGLQSTPVDAAPVLAPTATVDGLSAGLVAALAKHDQHQQATTSLEEQAHRFLGPEHDFFSSHEDMGIKDTVMCVVPFVADEGGASAVCTIMCALPRVCEATVVGCKTSGQNPTRHFRIVVDPAGTKQRWVLLCLRGLHLFENVDSAVQAAVEGSHGQLGRVTVLRGRHCMEVMLHEFMRDPACRAGADKVVTGEGVLSNRPLLDTVVARQQLRAFCRTAVCCSSLNAFDIADTPASESRTRDHSELHRRHQDSGLYSLLALFPPGSCHNVSVVFVPFKFVGSASSSAAARDYIHMRLLTKTVRKLEKESVDILLTHMGVMTEPCAAAMAQDCIAHAAVNSADKHANNWKERVAETHRALVGQVGYFLVVRGNSLYTRLPGVLGLPLLGYTLHNHPSCLISLSASLVNSQLNTQLVGEGHDAAVALGAEVDGAPSALEQSCYVYAALGDESTALLLTHICAVPGEDSPAPQDFLHAPVLMKGTPFSVTNANYERSAGRVYHTEPVPDYGAGSVPAGESDDELEPDNEATCLVLRSLCARSVASVHPSSELVVSAGSAGSAVAPTAVDVTCIVLTAEFIKLQSLSNVLDCLVNEHCRVVQCTTLYADTATARCLLQLAGQSSLSMKPPLEALVTQLNPPHGSQATNPLCVLAVEGSLAALMRLKALQPSTMQHKHQLKYFWQVPNPLSVAAEDSSSAPADAYGSAYGFKSKPVTSSVQHPPLWGVLSSSSARLAHDLILYCFDELHGACACVPA